MKECSKCKENKPTNMFRPDTRYLSGFHSQCKKCRSHSAMTSVRKRLYGITEEKYRDLIDNASKCESCGDTLIRPVVDHCHTRRKVRGVLCNNCNTALGLLKDDPKRIEKLKQYIEQVSLTYN